MNIDKLFKTPKLPSGSNKRKMPDAPTPDMLKKMKMDVVMQENDHDHASSQKTQTKTKTVTMEEVEDDEVEHDFAPGGDADYFAEEDEEGRFFGGGLTAEQKEILNIFDKSSGEGIQQDTDSLSLTSIRRMLLRLERAINKNQDQRSKYPDDPTKFIDSEADLDAAIKALLHLSQAPWVAYPELVRSGSLTRLIGLLAHENVDIVIDVIELIHELTDEEAGNEDEDEESAEETEVAMKSLVDGLLENSIMELLVDNLSRLNEDEEVDRQGAFHVLGIFENLLGFKPDLATELVSKTKILSWLLNRIQHKQHDENRGYTAELLSILLQDNTANRLELGKENGVEIILKVLSQYRRRDPVDADETEFMENIFDSLCSALSEVSIKKLFLEAEGPDLMILMMKDKMQSKSRAIKTLDYAMSGVASSAICEGFVEALGLKALFSAFMGKARKQRSTTITPASEDVAHMLGIMSSLLSNIASDSTSRIRFLAKFVEGGYEKADKLLEIRDNAHTRLKATNAAIVTEKKEKLAEGDSMRDDEDLWYLRRLDGGLFTLQTVDYILAWIIMEDDGIRAHVLKILGRKNQSLVDIVQTLRVYHDNIDDEPENKEDAVHESAPLKEILENLINALDTTNEQKHIQYT